jgi:hypothetical protein
VRIPIKQARRNARVEAQEETMQPKKIVTFDVFDVAQITVSAQMMLKTYSITGRDESIIVINRNIFEAICDELVVNPTEAVYLELLPYFKDAEHTYSLWVDGDGWLED